MSCEKWKWKWLSHVQLFVTPWTIQSMEFSRPESTFPSPGDLPSPGSNPGLLHYRQILYQLSHKGSPRILEWVAYPFSRGPSQPRNSLPAELPGKWSRAWVLHTDALPALAVWSLHRRITRGVLAKRVSLYFSWLEFSSGPFKICMFFIMSFLWWCKKRKKKIETSLCWQRSI